MTRINLVDPSELSTKHLVAEYREITRLPGNLRQSLNRKGKTFSLTEIPTQYVLGPGHVKFFYDKMKFLENRFVSLVNEMLNRGYKPMHTDPSIFKVEDQYYKDYQPDEVSIALNKQRIKDRTDKVKAIN